MQGKTTKQPGVRLWVLSNLWEVVHLPGASVCAVILLPRYTQLLVNVLRSLGVSPPLLLRGLDIVLYSSAHNRGPGPPQVGKLPSVAPVPAFSSLQLLSRLHHRAQQHVRQGDGSQSPWQPPDEFHSSPCIPREEAGIGWLP